MHGFGIRVTYVTKIATGPGSSSGRVSASGKGRSRVRDIPKSLKMILVAPHLALKLTG